MPRSETKPGGSGSQHNRESTMRSSLLLVWVVVGGAVAAMTALAWYRVVQLGGAAPGGDLVGHAATAQWLEALWWWDWRGWSEWFYGGQAIGVNYPPLSHAWMRLTHPVYGQMIAVTFGLVLLLPWSAVSLARAVGFGHRAQAAAVASVLVLTVASAKMHWVLSGFHITNTFFGSWPAMLATVLGLFAASCAARAHRPLTAGAVFGLAVLFNASVVPGIAMVTAVLLATSGATRSQVVRWIATVAAAASAVCAWWLVPFIAGWDRLVRFDVPLSTAWTSGGAWQLLGLASVFIGAVWASSKCGRASARLAAAAGSALAVTVAADLFGYLRAERWLEAPILVAAVAVAGAFNRAPTEISVSVSEGPQRSLRPSLAVVIAAAAVLMVPAVGRWEFLPLAIWALWGLRPSITALGGVAAWTLLLVWIPAWDWIRNPPEPTGDSEILAAVIQESGPDADGAVYVSPYYTTVAGQSNKCIWNHRWAPTAQSEGRTRTLDGLYRETSSTAEFISADQSLRSGAWHANNEVRPNWYRAWHTAGELSLSSTAAADALGARWYLECEPGDTYTIYEGPDIRAEGTRIVLHEDEEAWHRAAVEWYIAVASESAPLRPGGSAAVPVLWPGGGAEGAAAQPDRAAAGVSMRTAQDRLFVTAEHPGWVWLRVPWDPWWFAPDGVPLKGGPGHLVMWAPQGTTELRWEVPDHVDQLALGVTAWSLLLLLAMAGVNRRKGWEIDPDRPRPAAEVLSRVADAADQILMRAARFVIRRKPPPADGP